MGPDGAIYMGGWTGLTTDDGGDALLLKYLPDGTQVWSQQFGGLGEDWFDGITVAAGNLALSTQQLATLSANQLNTLGAAALICTIGTSQLQALTTAQIAGLNTASIRALAMSQVAGFGTWQVSAMSSASLNAFATNQLTALRPAQVIALSTAQVVSLGTYNLDALTTQQFAGMGTAQIAALTTAQVANLETADFAALGPAQIVALSTADIVMLSTAEMVAITTAQMPAFTTTQVRAITTQDMVAIERLDLLSLTSTQIASLSTAQINALATMSRVDGGVIGDTPLNAGSLFINGVGIGAVQSANAKDLATAINAKSNLTGVLASAQPTVAKNDDDDYQFSPITSVSVRVAPKIVSETGMQELTYTFTRTGKTDSALTVNVALGGSATEDDYTLSEDLRWGPGANKAWTKLFGGAGTDNAVEIAVSLDGSVYVTGSTTSAFDGQVNSSEAGTVVIFPNLGQDAFLTKYSATGEKLWTKLYGTKADDIGSGLTIGLDGSIYVCGQTGGSLDGQVSNGTFDAYITKFSPDGSKQWTQQIGTNNVDNATAIVTGADGGIYVTGSAFGWPWDRGPSPTPSALNGQTGFGLDDAVVSKFSPDGTRLWTKLLGTSFHKA
jgi:hypothetical protein